MRIEPASPIDDPMSRVSAVSQDGTLASFKYLGAGTVVSQDDEQIDVKLDYSGTNNNFAAWDRFGRVVDQLWADYGSAWTNFQPQPPQPPNNVDPDHFTYTYDRLGNPLTNGTSQTRTVNAANEITGISAGIDPAYDAAGNMRFAPKPGSPTTGEHYVYDAWNRLRSVYQDHVDQNGIGDDQFHPVDGTPPGDDPLVARYVYDGLGRRIVKTASTGFPIQYHTAYYYDQAGQVLEARQQNYGVAEQIDQYVWGPNGSPIVCLHDGGGQTGPSPYYEDIPDGALDANTGIWPATKDYARYYTTDANHNVTGVIEALAAGTASIVHMDRYVYSAYGTAKLYEENWTNAPSAPFTDGPLYAGYFFDSATGLYHTATRDYDPNLSTWINRDPIGYQAGTNLYEYCADGPTNRTDPSGLAWYDWFLPISEGQELGDFWSTLFTSPIDTHIKFMRQRKTRQRLQTSHGGDPRYMQQYQGIGYEGREAIGLVLETPGKTVETLTYAAQVTGTAELGGNLVGYAAGKLLLRPRVPVAPTERPSVPDFREVPFELPSESILIGAEPRPIVSQHIAGLGFEAAPAIQRSNAQLVQDIASRSAAWSTRKGITGSATEIGKAQHLYAERLLRRYQRIFGDQGLSPEVSVMEGRIVGPATGGSVRLDVLEGDVTLPTTIYDYKFGSAGLTANRINEIRLKAGYGPEVRILEVRP